MPQAAGVAVVGWMTAAGATAATAAAVGAIAAAAVTGAIVGAVIGAATAVMTGGDIFKGALKGALIGGISGGVLKGAGILTGISPAGSAFTNAAAGASAPTASAAVAPQVVSGAENTMAGNLVEGGAVPGIQAPSPTGILAGTPPPVAEVASTSKDSILAGAAEGLGTGVALVGQSLLDSDADKEVAEFAAQQEQQKISQNVPGKFESKTANITPPNWWDAHLNPNVR